LRQRLDPDALAWAIAHVEADDATPAALAALLPLPAEERAAWGKVQGLAVGVRAAGPELVLTAQVRGRDDATTEQLGDAVERSLGAAGVVARDRVRDGDWLRLSAVVEAEALRQWLGRLRGGEKK
jgi:hypothetical protein